MRHYGVMPKRNSRKRQNADSSDPNVMAHRMVEITSQAQEGDKKAPLERSLISEVMAEMGRRGGKKGGKRRLETMTPEERSRIALNAARVRWAKRPKQKPDQVAAYLRRTRTNGT